jgi:hypothetical protein
LRVDFSRLGLLLVSAALIACQRPAAPPLVEVSGVVSSRLREGDFLELRGRAFPEGRRAEITLRGEVARAGEPKTNGFELVLAGQSLSPHTVSVEITRNVERALGGVKTPVHATFHGSVEVSFAPRVSGTPPVTGQLADVELDFVPAEGDRAFMRARLDEGRRFAEFAGLLLVNGASGLVVDGVMPKSPAERAGVTRGDRLVELAGVHLLEVADFVPPPRARSAELVIERDGHSRRPLDVEGFRPAAARDFAAVASVIAALVVLCVLLASPFGRAVSFLEWRLIEALRGRREQTGPKPRGLRPANARVPVSITASEAFALLLGSGIVTAFGLGRSLLARELDVPLALISIVVAGALSALLFRVPGEQGLASRVRRFAAVLGRAVPAACAVLALIAGVGSFGVEDLAAAQGPLPWDWLIFRGPVELGLGLAWLVALVPETALGSSPCARLEARATPRARLVPSVLLGQFELIVMSGAIALAFFGGARVSTAAVTPTSVPLYLAGAALLLLKTWAIAGAASALRALLGRVDVTEAGALLWRGAVPASLVLATIALVVRRSTLIVAPGAERAVSLACLALCVTLALALARRVASGVRARTVDPGLNPWI